MVSGLDYLRALRDCCQDEAAFERLRALLNLADGSARLSLEARSVDAHSEDAHSVEERYRAMLDAIPDLMFRFDRQGHYLDCEGKQVVTLPREEIIGKHVTEILPPDVAEICLAAIRRTLETGRLQTCAYQLWVDGTLRDYEARLVVSGQDEVLSVVQDVTECQRVESDLQASEDRLRCFFEATFEAVIIHNFQQVLDVNPAAVELLGYPAEELIGMPVINLIAPESQEMVREKWRSLAHPDDSYSYEATGIRKDGSRFFGVVFAKGIQYRGQQARVASIRNITARKQAELRYQAMLNAIPDLMFRINLDGIYLDSKAEHDSDLLMPAKDLVGRSIYDVLPHDVAEQRMEYVRRAIATGEIQVFEYQLQLKHPSRYATTQTDCDPYLRDYEARVVVSGEDEALVIVRDISERKRSEAALRQSEEKFSKAWRSSPNPMSIATLLDGRMIDCNDGFLEVTGYTRDEVIGRQVHDLKVWANPGDRNKMVTLLQRDGSVHNLEHRLRTRSGEVREGLFSAEIIEINGEQCLIDTIVDITELKQAQAQLLATTERDRLLGEIALRIRQSLDLEQILNTTVEEVRRVLKADRVTIGLDLEDRRGQIVAESVDSRWPSMKGLIIEDTEYLEETRRGFAKREVEVVNDVDTSDHPRATRALTEFQVRAWLAVPIMLGNDFFGLLVVDQCDNSRQWRTEEIEFLVQLGTQVSIAIQQSKLYEQVRELNTSLEQKVRERTLELQQKNEELLELNALKDEFLNAFSHDLRTPVMGISLVINNLLNQPGDTIPISRAMLERMLQSNDYQLQLIKSLLEAHSVETRGVSLNYELVQLSLLIQVIAEDLEPLVAKNHATLRNEVPPDLPLVNADSMQIRRVFENLITNALNHNPPGICITISAAVEGDLIRFTIQDDGVGMAPETCDRLFTRYSRGPNSRHSTGVGLGLYLARQIITAHGGQIGVTSTPGSGATFWLTLPLAIPPGANPTPEEDLA
ncbi:MAG: PAS domain S-box protein [Cyanobacteriota bacterium]